MIRFPVVLSVPPLCEIVPVPELARVIDPGLTFPVPLIRIRPIPVEALPSTSALGENVPCPIE
jgi:hypothetical protein